MVPNPGNPNNGLYKTLSAPAYSISETSRLTGIKKWSVSRWLRGYKYHGGELDPVIRREIPPESTYASFLDLIDLLFVRKFIESGFSLQHIRKALDEARIHLGAYHFARSKFFTSSKEMILELPEGNMVALLKGGQRAMSEVIENVYDKVDFEEVTEFGFVRRWYPRGREGYIVIDPQISFGRPTIQGSGIATENVLDLYLGENEKIGPVESWFKIPRHHIQAAIRFETSLVA
ncbi:MAG: DUF433 domain-containing protein [Anaerolineales bacterium]|nr:DUF433 domain-containing protein [Anaerolineales bacterium]